MDAASIRRKADALEKANGDPAKVAELRALAPVERKSAPTVTADPNTPVETAKAPDADKLGNPVRAPMQHASRGPGRPRKDATSSA